MSTEPLPKSRSVTRNVRVIMKRLSKTSAILIRGLVAVLATLLIAVLLSSILGEDLITRYGLVIFGVPICLVCLNLLFARTSSASSEDERSP